MEMVDTVSLVAQDIPTAGPRPGLRVPGMLIRQFSRANCCGFPALYHLAWPRTPFRIRLAGLEFGVVEHQYHPRFRPHRTVVHCWLVDKTH